MPKYDIKFVGASAAPDGWTKIGNIAVNSSDNQSYPSGFITGISDSYNNTSYIIASDTTTAGLVGRTTGGGLGVASSNTPTWWITADKTSSSFISLAKKLTGSSSLSSASEAKTLLNSLGYWTSYSGVLPPPPPPPPPGSAISSDYILYYTTIAGFDSQSYSPYPTINYGDYITNFYKFQYSDTAFSATLSATGITNFFGGYTQGYATFSQLNGSDIAYVSATYTVGPDVALVSYEDPTTDISFIHGSGSSYSIYFVGRPEAFSDGPSSGIIFTTDDIAAPNIGKYEKMYVYSSGASPTGTFSVIFENGQENGIFKEVINIIQFEVGLTASSFNSQPLRIFSILGQNTNNTTSTAVWAYVNENLVATQSHITVPSSNDSSIGFLQMMSETQGFEKGGFYKGYFGGLLIYDFMHDSSTHLDIINELKSSYNIT